MNSRRAALLVFLSALTTAGPAIAQVLISELMYHPVERAAFDTNGVPVLDLTDDVHEFVELHNTNAVSVSLAGWRLAGGIAYEFPAGASVAPGGFVVVAKDPARLTALAAYALPAGSVLGPYAGQLGNAGDTVRLRNPADEVVDSVAYSPSFPWAIGADALGADDEWTGLNSSNFQYRGRSLERVSFRHSPNDPANWLASPLSPGPSPGRTNAVQLPAPRPIVLAFAAVQATDGAALIRSNQPVRIDVFFSATNSLDGPLIEFFIDDINSATEPWQPVAMTPVTTPSDGRYSAVLPGQPARSIVRYRIRANRGAGLETVSPRPDDPYAWHAYFVTPTRTSANPIYDVFISATSLSRLSANISQSPRRITLPDPPGLPRDSWNATEPAVFVHNSVVYDIRMRHHGSRYNRNASRRSYKFQWPEYARFNGRTSYFETDKGDEHRLGSKPYDAVDLPMWRARYVDIYLNNDAMDPALEQEEVDKDAYRRWIDEQAAKHPDDPRQSLGETYKATGVVPYETGVGQGTAPSYEGSGEGPYYIGNAAPIPPKAGWSLNERYAWTYGLQVDQWRGGDALRDLITALWAARGDSPTAPNPNLPALRAFLETHFDVDATLTYIAIRNWSAPFDNATHNHFLWRRGDGKWGMLPWDLDAEFQTTRATQSIFWDEFASPQPDTLRGPQWVKDSFMKAFREEYKQTAFILNNTLLSPAGLTNIGANGLLSAYAAARQPNVNSQLGLGPWSAPLRPTNVAPAHAAVVFPPTALQASPYLHSAPSNVPPHARTTWLIRRSGGSYSNAVLRVTSTTNLTSSPIPFSRLAYGETYFWKCIYFDANQHPSAESAETSFTYGAPPVPGNVLLNEILADNNGSVLNGGYAPDYIELFNTTASPQDLTQMSLSDDPAVPGKYTFPPGTVLAPNTHLIVWCDRATNAPGFHAGFQLDNDGQTVLLFTFANGAYTLADSIRFGLQLAGKSIGRITGTWTLNEPTPAAPNAAAALGSPGTLRINEWMATFSSGPDWFELFNPASLPVPLGGLFLSDNPSQRTNTRIAALSFIAANGHRRFDADDATGDSARHVQFRLGAGGDIILLSAADLSPIDTVSFGPQLTDVSQGRLPDGAVAVAAFPGSASPEAPNHLALTEVVINELVPDIELRNAAATPVDVSGWWLSDDPLVPRKYSIPTGSVIAAGGFWFVDDDELPFVLDQRRGGRVLLSRGDFSQTRRAFGPYDGHPYGTVPTSIGVDFVRQSAPTFGTANAGPLVGPVVISEIQFHPPDLPGDDDDYEFVELANVSAAPANLFLEAHPEIPWRLRDAVSFTFPAGTVLAAGERVLVLGFDPATNSVARSNFLATYTLPAGTRLFGPYRGKLDNQGASLELVAPQLPIDLPGPDYSSVPEILLERVNYGDAAPWPTAADGTGPSLQRRLLAGYGNEPLNWLANGVSPGAATTTNTPPTVAITSPASGVTLPFNQPIAIAADANDTDGTVRRLEFFVDGEFLAADVSAPFELNWTHAPAGPHVLTATAYDDRLGIVSSAPILITVSNAAPAVTLTAPTEGTFVTLPSDILLTATASDADGSIVKVEFLANGQRLAEILTRPFSFVWSNPKSGAYTLAARATDDAGAVTVSPAVNIVAAREITLAYVVETNTVGSQSLPNPYGIGMDFNVLTPIIVTHLGCFDSAGDGINSSSTLTTQIFNRNGPAPTVVASMAFSSTDPGQLIGGSRLRALSSPVFLTNGSYSIVGYGYDGNNRNGNLGTGNAKTWYTDDGGGLLAFVGGGRYGPVAPGAFPLTGDGGPADRYAAGTFQFRRLTPTPTIVAQPPSVFVRPGSATNLTVVAVGDAPLRYQWFFQGAPLSNATNATLSLVNVQAAQEGLYLVEVANALGRATSAPIALTLLITPGFALRPLDQLVVANGSFTVSTVITGAPPPFRFEWREVSNPRGVVVTSERTNYFTYGPVTNLATRQWRLIVTNAAAVSPGVNITFNVTALADSDGDGLPDAWETATGLNPTSPADRLLDGDGDGLTNLQEYEAGTDPDNADSYLRIDTIDINGGANVTFGALSNRTYTVQSSDGIGLPWTRLADVPAHPTNRVERIRDPAFHPLRYYRLSTPRTP